MLEQLILDGLEDMGICCVNPSPVAITPQTLESSGHQLPTVYIPLVMVQIF